MAQGTVHEQTQQLLRDRLAHVRGAALAASLLPLAAVTATPAAAQSAQCASGGICGYVWQDANQNGLQDEPAAGIEGAVVSVDGSPVAATDAEGFYYFWAGPGTYTIAVQIPPGMQPAPPNAGVDDTVDSDGVADGYGNSVAVMTLEEGQLADPDTDFGFTATPVVQPGTGTPGYWKNHPEAWPVAVIEVGGVAYTRDQAIAWLEQAGKDRTLTMFSSLVPALLNVLVGNDDSCVASTIASAQQWMADYGPVGAGVHAASFAWKVGEPLHRLMDNYNNGALCAPHRN